jgi:uncharacterized protein DUF4396
MSCRYGRPAAKRRFQRDGRHGRRTLRKRLSLGIFSDFAPGIVFHRLEIDSPEFWFMMQIAMIAGFLTSYPVNRRLLHTGSKKDLDCVSCRLLQEAFDGAHGFAHSAAFRY